MSIANAPEWESIQLGYSFRNIRTGNNHLYLCRLYEQASRFVNRIRWKVFWFKKGSRDGDEEKRLFPSKYSAPEDKDLISFEADFYDLLENIKFRKTGNPLMKKISRDLKDIKDSKKIIIFGDKSSNIYKVNKEE